MDGLSGDVQVATGGVRSTTTVPLALSATSGWDAPSTVTDAAARSRSIVPSVAPVPGETVIVYGPVPDPLTALTVQPAAVPPSWKSPAMRPLGSWLKVMVNDTGVDRVGDADTGENAVIPVGSVNQSRAYPDADWVPATWVMAITSPDAAAGYEDPPPPPALFPAASDASPPPPPNQPPPPPPPPKAVVAPPAPP